MHPKPQQRDAFELFQSHFDQLLKPAHELIQLAGKIDWARMEAAYAGQYSSDMGAPGKATRLMVGLHCLKYALNESENRWWRGGWRIPTGNISVATRTCSTGVRSIPPA